eukprot:scaffold290_cov364-Prasinococcus_capsulatus_cf.AAC.5
MEHAGAVSTRWAARARSAGGAHLPLWQDLRRPPCHVGRRVPPGCLSAPAKGSFWQDAWTGESCTSTQWRTLSALGL